MTRAISQQDVPLMLGCETHLLNSKNVYSAVVLPGTVLIRAKADHFFRIMEESGQETLPQLRQMARHEQLQVLKYFLTHVEDSSDAEAASMPNKEKFCSESAEQMKAGKKIREKLHQKLKQQMQAG